MIDEKGGIEDTWSASVTSDLFNYAIIEIEAVDISSNSDLTQKTLNSIGNILGMGDIKSSESFESVMEVSSLASYSDIVILGNYDVAMIKTLYKESLFLSKEINNLNPILTQYDNSENISIMEDY